MYFKVNLLIKLPVDDLGTAYNEQLSYFVSVMLRFKY